MPKISIITYLFSDIEKIIDTCEFSPLNAELELEIICPDEEIPKHTVDNIHFRGIKEIGKLPVPTKNNICFFADSASFAYYSKQNEVKSPILFVHPEIAILELNETDIFQTDLSIYGLSPCILENDSAEQLYCKREGLFVYKNLQMFLESKKPNSVLLTTNNRIAEALVSIDNEKWQVFYPEINYRDLRVEDSNAYRLLYIAQKQLLSQMRGLENSYDLAGIRYCQKNYSQSYSFFASHYDEYMAQVDYDIWVNYILSWYKQYSSLKLNKILELACGTANVAQKLVQKGYDVYACDMSLDMLKMASKKPSKPTLYYASMTDPIPGKDYQLVLCIFDSINYLMQAKQISKTLSEVSLALEKGGLFIFDISTLENSIDNFANICDLQHYSDGFMVHQAWFESVQLWQKSALHFFQKDAIGYNYQYEQHLQRVYFTTELLELINNSSLKVKAIHSAQNKTNLYPKHLSGIDEKYSRLFFILEKV